MGGKRRKQMARIRSINLLVWLRSLTADQNWSNIDCNNNMAMREEIDRY
jgi:hypothetical protein